MSESFEADVVVMGGGMAGMTAAGHAASRGMRVVVLEKAPDIGGSAVLSAAHLWTAPTYELLREHCPRGDAELGRVFVETFPEVVDWVRGTGVRFGEEIDVLYGRGRQFDILSYFSWCRSVVESNGGWVLPGRTVLGLLTDGGAVVGARVQDPEGVTDVEAPWTLLGTGGFQCDRQLLERYFGPKAGTLLLRSNRYSTGDGLRLAQEVGASTRGDMDTFYGHLIAWPLHEFEPKDYVRFTLVYSVQSILINVEGRRFADESLGDHLNNQRVAEQPDGRAALIFDEHIRQTAGRASITDAVEAIDTVEEARRGGARVASEPTLEALGGAIGEWGFDAKDLADVVGEFNAAMQDDTDGLEPGRRWNRAPLGDGPYYAVEVKPAITFTMGGLAIDADGRVLSDSGEPIPGLLAAGADTGGIFNGGYAGGLALASVFAYRGTRIAADAG